ncbi:MAG: prepilin-type N-terminal cleavage/methylation domain-containing protein [Gemmataceae bacterium]
MMHPRRSLILYQARMPRAGLSLLEVLVSLTVLLMALAAIARLVEIGNEDALASNFQAAATRLCQSKLAEVEAGAAPINGGSGTFSTETEWSWTVTSTPGAAPNLFIVTATVSRPYRNRTTSVTLTQMIVDPQAMGGAEEAQKPTTESTTGGTTP